MICSKCGNGADECIGDACTRCYKRLHKQGQRNRPGAKEERRKQDRVMYAAKKAALAVYKQQRLEEHKVAVFTLLGNKCNWHEGCTWTDPRALQIDHVNDDGNDERKRHGGDQISFYKRILRLENPQEKYQLLCACHNWIKAVEKRKFHQSQGAGIRGIG